MKYKTQIEAGAIAALALISAGAASAATVTSSTFTGLGGTTHAVSTTGTSGWGYNTSTTLFGGFTGGIASQGASYVHTGVKFGEIKQINTATFDGVTATAATSAGGTYTDVYFTENASNLVDYRNGTSAYTFDGNTAYGEMGQFQGTDFDVFTLEFRDLAVGTHTIALYFDGKGDGLDSYEMKYALNGGGFTSTTMTNIQSLTGNVEGNDLFSYNISLTTTAATDDLLLSFGKGSNVNRSGNMMFAGYTVASVPVPEPSTALLGGLGVLFLLRRRRI